jgi:hypothetical protein
VVIAIATVLRSAEVIRWPTQQEFVQLLHQNQQEAGFANTPWDKVVVFLDGTEVPVERGGQRYSGKKKQYSFNFQVGVLPTGQIVFASNKQEGTPHDQKHFNDIDFRSNFVADDEEGRKPTEYGFGTDGGYTGNSQEAVLSSGVQVNCWRPHRRTSLTEDQKLQNQAFSGVKVIVENVNKRLKDWKVLSTRIRHARAGVEQQVDIDDVFYVICCFVEFQRATESPFRQGNAYSRPKQTLEQHRQDLILKQDGEFAQSLAQQDQEDLQEAADLLKPFENDALTSRDLSNSRRSKRLHDKLERDNSKKQRC